MQGQEDDGNLSSSGCDTDINEDEERSNDGDREN